MQYKNGFILHGTPEECRTKGDSAYSFTIKLGGPKVFPGELYTIQVRAVNSHGPSEWSEEVVFRFSKCPPERPMIPVLKDTTPTRVTVIIELPMEMHVISPVHSCAVEYVSVNDVKAQKWQRSTRDIKFNDIGESVTMTIESLRPETKYTFRVIMINENGESQPSDEISTSTPQLIPGVPHDLRFSNKRTDKILKIRWNPPIENPQVVKVYEVQYKRAKSKRDKWTSIDPPVNRDKLSAKVEGLKTNTNYVFRVRAINYQGAKGPFTEDAENETRCGKASRLAAATGAFFGGVIGGPLIGAVGAGVASGVAAEDKSENTAAGVAAGVGGGVGGALLGTIGAPVIGGITAAGVYHMMGGEFDSVSPQTSDEEI